MGTNILLIKALKEKLEIKELRRLELQLGSSSVGEGGLENPPSRSYICKSVNRGGRRTQEGPGRHNRQPKPKSHRSNTNSDDYCHFPPQEDYDPEMDLL